MHNKVSDSNNKMQTKKFTLGNKIRLFRREKDFTQRSFAKLLGVHYQTLLRYEKDIVVPKGEFFERLTELFPDVNINYFLGSEFETPETRIIQSSVQDTGLIPLIAWTTAGELSEFTDQGWPAGSSDVWISSSWASKDPNAFCVQVTSDGDSMTPLIKPGAVLTISPSSECRSGDMALIKLKDGRSVFKEIYIKGDNFILHPYNDDYEDITVSKRDILFCYPVVQINPRGL